MTSSPAGPVGQPAGTRHAVPVTRGRLTTTLWRTGVFRRSFSRELILSECASFEGDIPATHRSPEIGRIPSPGSTSANYVCDAAFRDARPETATYRDVVYTPGGFAWIGGRLDESLSSTAPTGRAVLERLVPASERLERATVVQSENPHTYGDWCSEYVRRIARSPGFPRPLLLPERLYAKPYVRGELDRLGVDAVCCSQSVRIAEACVLHKTTPGNHWSHEDVDAYRTLFGLRPRPPRPGSLLYLSRQGVRSEQALADRSHASEFVARLVRKLGGRVVETAGLHHDDFAQLADDAETVVADHGAALFNILQWRTRTVVELVSSSWWSRCFVFLGVACGVQRHVVLRSDRSPDDLAARLESIVGAALRAG